MEQRLRHDRPDTSLPPIWIREENAFNTKDLGSVGQIRRYETVQTRDQNQLWSIYYGTMSGWQKLYQILGTA